MKRCFLALALILSFCFAFCACDREINNDYQYEGGLPSFGNEDTDDRDGETADFPYLPIA